MFGGDGRGAECYKVLQSKAKYWGEVVFGEMGGEEGLWVLLPRTSKTHLYLLGSSGQLYTIELHCIVSIGEGEGSNPVNHLHSATLLCHCSDN